MKVVWTTNAKKDLREIVSYIWLDNPVAARELRSRVQTMAAYLGSQPFMGRPGAIPGTREAIPHPSYRMVYQVAEDTVHIVAVVHTARQWPPASEEPG